MKTETAPLDGGTTRTGETARNLFEGAEIRLQDETFRRKSDQARHERRRLYWMLRTLNLLVLAVGVLSGLLLAVAIIRGWQVDPARPFTRLVNHADAAEKTLVTLIILCTVCASAIGRIMHEGDSLARYRRLRSEAEAARAGRFTMLARRAAEIGPAPALDALELIRTGLLEDQRAFYLRRAEEHRSSLARTGQWAALGIVLSALASMAAVTVLSSEWTQPLLVLGVIAAAISAFAIDREGMNRDRVNAELYELTAERLGLLGAGIDRVRAEVAGGNAQAVVVFADLVSDELQHEHRRWMAGLDATNQLLARLEDRLAEARTRAEGIATAARPPTIPTPARAPVPAEPQAAPPDPPSEPRPEAAPAAIAPMAASAAPPDARATAQALAARLGRWRPVLIAAAAVLPPAEAAQAQALLDEIGTVATPLAALLPAPEAVAQATRLAALLDGGAPISEWLAAGADVARLALPPAAILLAAAGLAAQLGEDAYRRWVARVLDAPAPAALVRAQPIDVTVATAALEQAPILAEALAAERREGNGPARLSFVRRALDQPDALWPEVAERFGNDRADFDAGIRELTRALLGPASNADLAALTAPVAEKVTAPRIAALAADPLAAPLLRKAVLLLHEIRAEGGTAAAEMLVDCLRKGQVP